MDPTIYTKAVLVGKAPNESGQDVYTFRATTAAVDRTGEIVTLDGWDFSSWDANPVILDSHDYYGIEKIVGKGVPPMRMVDGAWEVDVMFAGTSRGQMAKQLVDDGCLRAVSVGFRSLQRVYDETTETMSHTKKELLEISVVPIPANQEAVRVRGVGSDTEAAALDLAKAAGDMATDLKAGRVLSTKNENLIRSAAESLLSVLDSLGPTDGEASKSASGSDAADPPAEQTLAVDLSALRAFAGGQ
jgi:HK97 family phage prohead protease